MCKYRAKRANFIGLSIILLYNNKLRNIDIHPLSLGQWNCIKNCTGKIHKLLWAFYEIQAYFQRFPSFPKVASSVLPTMPVSSLPTQAPCRFKAGT
jgi:hypothetical protein